MTLVIAHLPDGTVVRSDVRSGADGACHRYLVTDPSGAVCAFGSLREVHDWLRARTG